MHLPKFLDGPHRFPLPQRASSSQHQNLGGRGIAAAALCNQPMVVLKLDEGMQEMAPSSSRKDRALVLQLAGGMHTVAAAPSRKEPMVMLKLAEGTRSSPPARMGPRSVEDRQQRHTQPGWHRPCWTTNMGSNSALWMHSATRCQDPAMKMLTRSLTPRRGLAQCYQPKGP